MPPLVGERHEQVGRVGRAPAGDGPDSWKSGEGEDREKVVRMTVNGVSSGQ